MMYTAYAIVFEPFVEDLHPVSHHELCSNVRITFQLTLFFPERKSKKEVAFTTTRKVHTITDFI